MIKTVSHAPIISDGATVHLKLDQVSHIPHCEPEILCINKLCSNTLVIILSMIISIMNNEVYCENKVTHINTKLVLVDDYYMEGVKQVERRFRDTQSKLYELTKEFDRLNDELAKQRDINKELMNQMKAENTLDLMHLLIQ